MRTQLATILLAVLLGAAPAGARSLTVTMNLLDAQGVGKPIGTVTVAEGAYGLIFTPALTGLTPGVHGFHVHEKGSCAAAEKDGTPVPGLAAGGHYDPGSTGRHLGPYAEGHLGDLPALFAGPDGAATTPVLAPRLELADLAGRALMIHAGGDNYADTPAPLGGGGARAACGVVK